MNIRYAPGDHVGRLMLLQLQRRLGTSGWDYRCSCGRCGWVASNALTQTQSCGCLARESAQRVGRSNLRHGLHASSEYRAWCSMIQRCTNPRAECFARYGGRGISVSARWRASFENFLSDLGRKPSPAHSLDRIDVNGNYNRENCRWATLSEQNSNRRHYSRKQRTFKLSRETRDTILALRHGFSRRELGRAFGVGHGTINRLIHEYENMRTAFGPVPVAAGGGAP
jgi:hypothetical protein